MLKSKVAGFGVAATAVIGLVALVVVTCQNGGESGEMFHHEMVDARGPTDPWGKSVGDLNADGLPDLLVGGHGSKELVWYANPDWKRATIAENKHFSTDHEVADIDRDGRNDVVSLTRSELIWYRNPDWKPTIIATSKLHDIEVGDFDKDGDQDIVGRNQSAFGGSGAVILLYEQEAPDRWHETALDAPSGEGLKLADVSGDGYPDIIVNSIWFKNPTTRIGDVWQKHIYSRSWTWPHTFIATGDIDGDGRPDIVLAPAELKDGRYRLSWFQAPSDPDKEWTEHTIVQDVETVMHFVGVDDMDSDGDLDVVGAEMFQGTDPDNITVYLNGGGGKRWIPVVVATTGSHNMRLADLDLDGDADLFGANWSGDNQDVELWRNQTCPQKSQWHRHVLDGELPWTAVFAIPADVDQDGYQDILAGGWWYRNPGLIGLQWERRPIGPGIAQVAAVLDCDKDGIPDVLGTKGEGGVNGGDLLLVRNLGGAEFAAPRLVAETEGDFLQGVAVGDFNATNSAQVALSWHRSGMGVQMLKAPQDVGRSWTLEAISQTAQDEALSAGDIDRDGDLDLLLGTTWLENTDAGWSTHNLELTDAKPDRNHLVDLNGDGKLDAVVGFEAISEVGDIAWYEQPENPRKEWRRRKIASIVGPMSLDVVDLDRDGDLDIVAGEHNLDRPKEAGLYLFTNIDGKGHQWERHLIHRGDEHHDGAQTADFDNDGDLDIVSIGWGHNKVVVYENRRTACDRAK